MKENGDGSLMFEAKEFEVYEANVDFVVRACVELGIRPEEWVCVSHEADWFANHVEGEPAITVIAQAHHVTRAPDNLQTINPNQVALMMDCEMANPGSFPQPETEQVLQTCCVVYDPLADPMAEQATRVSFTLLDCKTPRDIVEKEHVFSFRSESDLLLALSLYIRVLQPDIISGWNVESFDLWYLHERAKVLGIFDQFSKLTRNSQKGFSVRDARFESSAHGALSFKEVKGEGLFVWDLLISFQKNTQVKLFSYKLDRVASTLLNEHKRDVAYSQINKLQETPEGREELRQYCMQDALLPARIMGHQQLLLRDMSFARINGVPIDMVTRRGMQIRVTSLMLWKLRNGNPRYLLMTLTPEQRAVHRAYALTGAYVFPPMRGLHLRWMSVLDFKSLYPSIIMTFNMCITTYVPLEKARQLIASGDMAESDFFLIDNPARNGIKAAFVRHHVRVGMLPIVCRDLLNERSAIKKKMNAAFEAGLTALGAVLNHKQLAVKVNANSVYGATGAPDSDLSAFFVAAATTFMGQTLIKLTADWCKELCHGVEIAYGDTDSVFVLLPQNTSQDAAVSMSKLLAKEITERFQVKYGKHAFNVIELEFEKLLLNALLMAKKKYAYQRYELKKDKFKNCVLMYTGLSTSGLEDTRRDSSIIVGNALLDVLAILLEMTNATQQNRFERVKKYVARVQTEIRQGHCPIHDLIETRQIRKHISEYAGSTTNIPAHVQLVERLRQRYGNNSGLVPKSGDRIEMLWIQQYKKAKAGTGVEDPWYALEHGMKPDVHHYITKSLYPVIARIVGPLLVEDTYIDDNKRKKAELTTFTKEMLSVREPRMFPQHRLVDNKTARSNSVSSSSSAPPPAKRPRVMGFAPIQRRRCVVCGTVLRHGTKNTCAKHTAEEIAAYNQSAQECVDNLRALREDTLATCIKCAHGKDAGVPVLGDMEDISAIVPCQTTACPIYGKRETRAHPNNATWRKYQEGNLLAQR